MALANIQCKRARILYDIDFYVHVLILTPSMNDKWRMCEAKHVSQASLPVCALQRKPQAIKGTPDITEGTPGAKGEHSFPAGVDLEELKKYGGVHQAGGRNVCWSLYCHFMAWWIPTTASEKKTGDMLGKWKDRRPLLRSNSS